MGFYMSGTSIFLFYVASFFISFVLCIPIGPVNLEVFHHAVTKRYSYAIAISVGAAIGDAIWAMSAFFGIRPFMQNRYSEGIFLSITAVVTLILGIFTLRDATFVARIERKEEERVKRIKRKRWALVKGLTMVLINPLGIASWMICLSFLRKLHIYIPMQLNFQIFFFIVVVLGVATYFFTIIVITNRVKELFNPETTHKVIRILGYLLIVFSIYFFFNAGRAFFISNQSYRLMH
jgi:threonine/homoserine/homoserine lactone efflux protein